MSASDRIRWFLASHMTEVVEAAGQMCRALVPWPGWVSSSTWLLCTSTVMSALGVVSAAGSAAGSAAASAIVACVYKGSLRAAWTVLGSLRARAGVKGSLGYGPEFGSSVLTRCGEGQPSAALVACVLSVTDGSSLARRQALLPASHGNEARRCRDGRSCTK